MKNFLNLELPGHKYWGGTHDILFQWDEPSIVQTLGYTEQIRQSLLALPILFPVFGGVGLLLFALKVWKNGHSLKEVPWQGLLLVSLLLATLFTSFPLIQIVLKRYSRLTVRLADKGIGKWKRGWGREFCCDYDQITLVTLGSHHSLPQVQALSVLLKSGETACLAGGDDDLKKAVEILRQKGVRCELGPK